MPRRSIRRFGKLKKSVVKPALSGGPTAYQRFAMSKPVGKVLDSKIGGAMAKFGKSLTTFPDEGKLNRAQDARNRANAPVGAIGGTNKEEYKPGVLGSFKKGGKVKKTGKYKLHKGEMVVPAKKVKKMKKVMKSANPGDLFNKFAKKKK